MRAGLFDYGAGNLHSLAKALELGGASVTVTTSWEAALAQDVLVLPGVGSFGAAVRSLAGREEEVRARLQEGLPCLGICLGMQLLLQDSEEGEGRGIGLVEGSVRRLDAGIVPQMGWNEIYSTSDPVLDGLEGMVAYYANSFVCKPADPSSVVAASRYDGMEFPAAIRNGNTLGVQFHPEKSSAPGLTLIRNFLESVR